ncbi:MAG: DUF349 domain-containing protein [Bacteroidia bacterium]
MVEAQNPEAPQGEITFPDQLHQTLQELLQYRFEELKRLLYQEKPDLAQIVLLLEYLNRFNYRREFNSLVQAFRHYVNFHLPQWRTESKTKEELARLDALQKRYEDALVQFENRRLAHEEQCKQNAEKARALLKELQTIVVEEQLDKLSRVRQISRQWTVLRKELLGPDRKELSYPFKASLKAFHDLYQRYKDIFQAEQAALLERRKQILQEIERLFPPENVQTTAEFWQQQRDRLAVLQVEWDSLPRLRTRQAKELYQQYYQLIRKFRQAYLLFRSQAYQRVQKNPILQETYRRKKQIIELLQPLVERAYASLEEWKQVNQKVREFIREWRSLTEKSLAQDDSREVRRFYAPLNQQFSELLDQFHEKSEVFSQQYREKQLARLKEIGQEFLKKAEKLLKKGDPVEGLRLYRAQFPVWRRRFQRFQKEPEIAELHTKILALGDQLKEAHKLQAQKLAENLEKRNKLLNELESLAYNGSRDKLNEFVAKLLEYENCGEVAPSHRERLKTRQRQAVQQFLAASGISQSDFQEALLTHQLATQTPQQIRKTIDSLKAQIKQYRQEIQGYQNTLALLARGKGSEPLRQELEQKISDTQANLQRTQELLQRLQSASASSTPSA